jgi:hypothetical protein
LCFNREIFGKYLLSETFPETKFSKELFVNNGV